jgi:anaerobic glycerol-3-phosphate dehydrogenase
VCAVTDANGRVIEAQAFILATGGVLMGGLEVDSHGHICEPALGLDVYQTEPLSQIGSQAAVNALHSAGIETDEHFKPRHKGNLAWRNLFVTGRNLAHWNPGAEISAEGVAIVSGWVAAEAANDVLEGGP